MSASLDELTSLKEENHQMKHTLFNLNKLYTEKFEIVKANEAVARAKAEQEAVNRELRTQLSQQEEMVVGLVTCFVERQTRARQAQLLTAVMREELTALQHRLEKTSQQLEAAIRHKEEGQHEMDRVQTLLAESAGLIEMRDAELKNKDGEFQRIRISWRWQVAALNTKLTELKEAFLDEQQKRMETAMLLEQARTDVEAAKAQLKLSAEKQAKLEQARKTFAAELEKKYQLEKMEYLNEYNAADAVSGTTHMDMHSWGLPSALASGTAGIAKLRELMSPSSKSFGGALETDDVRKTLRTVRRICVDRALVDLQPQFLCLDGLNLPEYVYAWFRTVHTSQRSKQPREQGPADFECQRFVNDLCRLAPKHRELALFHDLLDCAEPDEVSYFMQARRVVLGLEVSRKSYEEVHMAVASQACERLIMSHADDAHARATRAKAGLLLLSSRNVCTPDGAADVVALLGGLLSVYREEKETVRTLLSSLHREQARLPALPAVQRLRALLQALDPHVSDHVVLRVLLQAGIHTPAPPDRPGPPTREVPFGALWMVLQRGGFLVQRQRLTAAFRPQVSHEESLARLVPGVVSVWMGMRAHVRTVLQAAAESPLEADRLWAAQGEELYRGLQESVSSQRDAAMAIFRLRRLLASLATWRCYEHERSSRLPTTPEAVTGELEALADSILMRRVTDMQSRARTNSPRHRSKSPTKEVVPQAPAVEVEVVQQGMRVSNDPRRRPFTATTNHKAASGLRPYTAK